MSGQNDVGEWYNNLPKVFRAVFTAMVVGPLVLRFQLVNPALLIADYEKFFWSFKTRLKIQSTSEFFSKF